MGESVYESLEKTTFSPQLSFSEEEFQHLAEAYGTPLYVFDESMLRKKLAQLEDAYSDFKGPVRIAYSVKANFNPAVIKIFASEGILFDLASINELYFVTQSGGSLENIIYTSVTEEFKEYEILLDKGVLRIVVSSCSGLSSLLRAAGTSRFKPRVLIRVNPEVGVRAEVRASYRNGKFGVPFNTGTNDSAAHILRTILSSNKVEFGGFHFHLGSQITDPTCFVNALEKAENFIRKAKKEFPNLTVPEIDIGGGMPVFYGDSIPSPSEMARPVVEKLNALKDGWGEPFTLIVESGRFLTAEPFVMISKIVNTKQYGEHKFIILDSGYHVLLDAALLHQAYPQRVIPSSHKSEDLKAHLAGKLCDTYDIFPISKVSDLSGSEQGKLVVTYNVGAYSMVFNMPFHCETKPPIVMRRSNGDYALVRGRQTVEDLYREEGGNSSI